MIQTSPSLLHRLRLARPDDPDWQRLQELYAPWIRLRLASVPGVGDAADDLVQEVLLVVVRQLPGFVRQRDGSFRAWLRQIVVNRVRTHRRSQRHRPAPAADETEHFLQQLEDPNSDPSRQWDEEHDRHVVRKLLAAVEHDFTPATWQAFTRFALDGAPAGVVARELSLSESAVMQAKFRVLKRLREEAGELMD